MKEIAVPADAHQPGDVVETLGGTFGVIVSHGWDAEGSFGYLVRVNRYADRVWTYHHRELSVFKRKE